MQQRERLGVEMRLPELGVVPFMAGRRRDQIRPAPVRLRDGKASLLQIRTLHARTLFEDENASLDNLRQAVELLEDIDSISSRVFGARHPDTAANRSMLSSAREKLAQAEAPVARRTRSKAGES